MRLFAPLLRFFFYHFYHSLAWTYDLVAGSVSLGRWEDWIHAALPRLQGSRVLELGHGTGHLQRFGLESGLSMVGLDESRQMGLLARRRLKDSGYAHLTLIRGRAQALPFPAAAFDSLVASFPSNYIFELGTLSEAQRVLVPGGRMVVLAAAWLVGRSWPERAAAWLFRVTGESPHPMQALGLRLRLPFEASGFRVQIEYIEVRSSIVLAILAEKPI
jgi:ubiquinone/menaquinone biosynthesis C-methylase UbiE